MYTLPTDQLFNLEFQFESVFNLEFQPKFGIQLGIPIPMRINLGECRDGTILVLVSEISTYWQFFSAIGILVSVIA